jgi:thiosulfate dehydrogenase
MPKMHLAKARPWLLLPGLAVMVLFAAADFTGVIQAAPQGSQRLAPPSGTPPVLTSQEQLVRQGKLIFDDTPRYATQWTGNVLTCTDCHRLSGTLPYATPLTATAGRYPRFSKRAGHVVTLQQRIQECFVRSENGKPLPVNSAQMKALAAYIQSISANGDKGKTSEYLPLVSLPALKGNPIRGKVLYADQCAACHQANGEGRPEAYPPVWGSNSYNDGAGMSHNAKFAAWIQYNMPVQRPNTLSAQQAWDIAAYVNSQPRPKFNDAYKTY